MRRGWAKLVPAPPRRKRAVLGRLAGGDENAACLWACVDDAKTAAPSIARDSASMRLFMDRSFTTSPISGFLFQATYSLSGPRSQDLDCFSLLRFGVGLSVLDSRPIQRVSVRDHDGLVRWDKTYVLAFEEHFLVWPLGIAFVRPLPAR